VVAAPGGTEGRRVLNQSRSEEIGEGTRDSDPVPSQITQKNDGNEDVVATTMETGSMQIEVDHIEMRIEIDMMIEMEEMKMKREAGEGEDGMEEMTTRGTAALMMVAGRGGVGEMMKVTETIHRHHHHLMTVVLHCLRDAAVDEETCRTSERMVQRTTLSRR